MELFESTLLLLFAALVLMRLTRRLPVPYPTMLALAGVAVAAMPGAPDIGIDPALALALFIAPAVFDAAFDFPPREMRRHWIALLSLAGVAVVVTTGVVAWVGVALAGLPWAAAIALGAVVAPPDAAAATAVLGRFPHLPRATVTVLKGESLLNDAVSLLIFSAAVSLVMRETTLTRLIPELALAAPGGLLFGYVIARLMLPMTPCFSGQLSGAVLGFVMTFGVWIVAEKLHLSAVLATVAFGMYLGVHAPARGKARDRVHTYSLWNTAVFLLNVLAFLLLGLQARSIVAGMASDALIDALTFAGAVLAAVIVTRLGWVMLHRALVSGIYRRQGRPVPLWRQSLLVGWCGMRGLVTLATALALPDGFPQRDLIVLTAFTVVLGTLVLQGLTLAPLISLLRLTPDDSLRHEVAQTRAILLDAALARVDDGSEAAMRLKEFYAAERDAALAGQRPHSVLPIDGLKRLGLQAQRDKLAELRAAGTIDDDVFHTLEHQLDWTEIAMTPPERFEMEEG